ncbi:MAG: T9SS type A sorting domain-containing protein [Bacteroidota bacterium]
MKFLLGVSLFILQCGLLYSSNWESLGYGLNGAAYTIFIDSTNGKVYAGGQFSEADSITVRGIAVWDGVHWDSLAHGSTGYHWAITKYQNKIYADGVYFQNTLLFGGIFDGVSWDSIGRGVIGDIYQLKEINNSLWISGGFVVRGDPDSCKMLATWDGANWSCLNVPYDEGRIEDFEFLNGTLVIGGNFFDSTNTGVDIAYFDGTNFQTMGHRLYGGFSVIHAMTLYRGELYIAGYFTQAEGNEGNHIMKWNGTQWEDVGGGTDSWILCMRVYNDELYVGGVFEYAGGVHTGNLAKWNGIQWSTVTPSIIYGQTGISDIQFSNGALYIGGYFLTIDTVHVNHIAKYTFPLTTGDFSKPSLGFNLTPSPSNSFITVSFSSPLMEDAVLTATDAQGRKQFRIFIPRQTMRKELDIAELAAGVFFVTLVSEQGSVTRKLIKE